MADASKYAEWLVANESKKGTPEFETVANAYKIARQAPAVRDMDQSREMVQQRAKAMKERDDRLAEAKRIQDENLAALDRRQQWDAAAQVAQYDKLLGAKMGAMAIASELVPKAVEMAKGAAVEGGPISVGQMAGQRIAGAPGRIAGGAIGGAAGSLLNQLLEKMSGGRESIEPGRVLSNAFAGAFATQGAKRNAAINASAETIRSLIDEQRLPTLEGVSQAAAAGYVAGKVSKAISGKQLSPMDDLMEYRNNAFRALRKEGVVVNPQELSRKTFGAASVAGEGPLNTAASRKNQFVWQKLAREELGIDKQPRPFRRTVIDGNGNVVKGDIDLAIERASKPYNEIRSISDSAKKELSDFHSKKGRLKTLAGKSQQEIDDILSANQNLDSLKAIRQDIREYGAALKRGDPDAYKQLQAARMTEDALEAKIESAAVAIGRPSLLKELKDSRVKLSKAFAVRDAVNDVTGLIDINELASMRATSSKPGRMLTGNLAKMADFSEAFGRNAVEAVAAAVDRPASVSVNYSARQIAQGQASGALSAGVPLLSSAAKKSLLSDFLQDRFAKPNYVASPANNPSIVTRNAIMALGRQTPERQEPIAETP